MQFLASRRGAASNLLHRRFFLKALGLGVAAPLAAKMADLAVAAPGERPTRLFIYYIPHGVPNEHYEVMESAGTMDLAASGEGILAPLEPFKQHLNVLRGTENLVKDNHESLETMLTGELGATASIDFSIAQQLGTTAHVLGVHPYREGQGIVDESRLANHGSWVAAVTDPAAAADRLFAGFETIDPSEPAIGDDEFRMRTLAFTEREVEQLQSELSGLTSEENKLQIHLDSLQATRNRWEGGSGFAGADCTVRPDLSSVSGLDPFDTDNFAAMLESLLNVSADAFNCGAAQIITFQNMYFHADIAFDPNGAPTVGSGGKAHHATLSHAGLISADLRAEFALCQRWFYQMLADHFLSRLAETDPLDPEHSVLDNTTVLVMSEVGDGALHNAKHIEDPSIWRTEVGSVEQPTYLPWNLIGGGGGYFKTGQITRIDHLDYRRVLAAVAESMGAPMPIAGSNYAAPMELKA